MANAKVVFSETTQVKDGDITDPVVDRKTVEQEIDITEYTDQVMKVAKADADVQVNFCGVTTGKFLRIESDYPIKVKIDDTGSTERVVTSRFIWHGSFTALYVSGDGTNDALAKIFIGGE